MPELTAEDGTENIIILNIYRKKVIIKWRATYSVAEFREIALYDCLNDFTVDVCQPDTHLRSEHEQQSEDDDIL
jgi:hypothetical protein